MSGECKRKKVDGPNASERAGEDVFLLNEGKRSTLGGHCLAAAVRDCGCGNPTRTSSTLHGEKHCSQRQAQYSETESTDREEKGAKEKKDERNERGGGDGARLDAGWPLYEAHDEIFQVALIESAKTTDRVSLETERNLRRLAS